MTLKRLFYCLTMLLIIGSAGCASNKVQLLKLYPYRKNLILDKDHVIYFVKFQNRKTVKEELPLTDLGSQLRRRNVRKTDPIVIHCHRYAAPSVVDQVVDTLRKAGYLSIYCVEFRDPNPTEKKPPAKS